MLHLIQDREEIPPSTEQKISVPQKSFASRFSVGLSVRALFRFILSVLVVTDDSLDLPNGELWSLFAASHLRLQMSECRNQSLRGEGEREKDGDSFDFRQISEQFRRNLGSHRHLAWVLGTENDTDVVISKPPQFCQSGGIEESCGQCN